MRAVGVVLVAGCVLAAGCGEGSMPRTFTEGDDGGRVELDVGDEIEVTLPANPSTGYTWEIAEDSTECLRLHDEPEYVSMSDLLGAAGVMRFELDAVEAGTGELRLAYRRPWEEQAPERTFGMEVVVTG